MKKTRKQYLAHNIGHHIEKLAHDGIDGWGMTASEVIEAIYEFSMILEKLAKDEILSQDEVGLLKKNNLYPIVLRRGMKKDVLNFILTRFHHEVRIKDVDEPDLDPNRLLDLMSAIINDMPINHLYYSDVVVDHFLSE